MSPGNGEAKQAMLWCKPASFASPLLAPVKELVGRW